MQVYEEEEEEKKIKNIFLYTFWSDDCAHVGSIMVCGMPISLNFF